MTLVLHIALIWLTAAACLGLLIGAVIDRADREADAARAR